MMDIAPEAVVTIAALGNEAVDMGVPFQIPAESMEDHDKAGREVHGFIEFQEHAGHDTGNSVEKAAEQAPVMEEEIPELFINGKNAVAVGNINEFKGHIRSALHSVFIATSGAETAFAAERDKFMFPTFGAAVHGAAKRRVTAGYHFINILHLGFAGMERIFNFFIMVFKNFL